MIHASSFKQNLVQNKPQIGVLVTLGHPSIAEILSACGYDWLWIDLEHGSLSLESAQQMLQVKSKDCAALVRIPTNDETWIKRILDLGADGIIVPQVKTAKEAAFAVNAAKYPPLGTRSVGIARAHGYGADFTTYINEANDRLTTIIQIEHIEAVHNIDAILKVAGIDAVIIGPYDLSGSMGKLGEVQDAEVQKAIQTVHTACKKQKKPVGIFALQADQGKSYLAQGYELLALGIDSHLLMSAAKSALAASK